jgi:hypothetical protein
MTDRSRPPFNSKFRAWYAEHTDRLSQITDWRELCLELLEAAEEMTIENDGCDSHFELVAQRVKEFANEDNSISENV